MTKAAEAAWAEGRRRLQAMEDARVRAEREGRWLEAQEWQDRMQRCNAELIRELEKASQHAFDAVRDELVARQEAEQQELEDAWTTKLAEYERQARAVVEYTEQRHAQQEEAKVAELRQQILGRRLVVSKRVTKTRALIETLVKQRQYVAADELRAEVAVWEQEEASRHQEELKALCARRERGVRLGHAQEMQALLQRVESGRRELTIQRTMALERLAQTHQNALAHLAQQARLHHARTREWATRQLAALNHSPTKTRFPASPRQAAWEESPRSPQARLTPRSVRSPPARQPPLPLPS